MRIIPRQVIEMSQSEFATLLDGVACEACRSLTMRTTHSKACSLAQMIKKHGPTIGTISITTMREWEV